MPVERIQVSDQILLAEGDGGPLTLAEAETEVLTRVRVVMQDNIAEPRRRRPATSTSQFVDCDR
jgi:hypothetical protein